MTTLLQARARDGFALPAALLAMIVIGAIVTGGFYVAGQEHDISVSTDHGSRAMHVAQYGLEESLATWTNAALAGYTGPVTRTLWSGARPLGTYQIRMMHLGNRLYALESQGEVPRGQQTATRRVGALVRTTTAQAPYRSAMTVIGGLTREGNATISGTDQCGSDATAPGVVAKDDDLITGVTKGSGEEMITGSPAVAEDPDMTLDKLNDFGDIDLDELISMATHYYQGNPAHPQHMAPATTVDGSGATVCNTAVNLNWGDPSDTPGVCGSYYPIIYVNSNARLDVGKGQGILIVKGDLEVKGNFEFSGVVIVKGSFFMEGTGSKLNGSVIVQGEGSVDTENAQSGNAKVQYNSCKVNAAFANNLRVRPVASRSWLADAPPLP
jgi:Tfp pilus assembly protein PilX